MRKTFKQKGGWAADYDSAGAVMVESTLVVGLLLLITFGGLQLLYCLLQQLGMSYALQNVSRFAITGLKPNGADYYTLDDTVGGGPRDGKIKELIKTEAQKWGIKVESSQISLCKLAVPLPASGPACAEPGTIGGSADLFMISVDLPIRAFRETPLFTYRHRIIAASQDFI